MLKTMAPWIAVVLVMGIADRIKEKKREEVGNNETKFEVKSIKFYFWIMLTCLLVGIGLLYLAVMLEQLDWFVGIISGSFAVSSFIGVLATSLWRVRVDGNDIEFRSTFGITRKYKFEDITLGVYEKSGALRIYSGEKKLFTFGDALDMGQFEDRMNSNGIKIITIAEMKGASVDEHVMKPRLLYYILIVFMLIFWVGMVALAIVQRILLSPLGIGNFVIAVALLIILVEFIVEKTTIKDNTIYQFKLFKGKKELHFSQIRRIERKKNMFRENIIVYGSVGEKIYIWRENNNVDLFELKLKMERKKFGYKLRVWRRT